MRLLSVVLPHTWWMPLSVVIRCYFDFSWFQEMLVARCALGFLIVAAAAVASVSIGIDRWTIHSADSTFFITGLRRSCTVSGCSRNSYDASLIALGNCSVSSSTYESLNDAAWGIQIAGVGTLGVGAILMIASAYRGIPLYVVSLIVAVLGGIAYVVGGGMAYHTHNEWLYCGLTFCDNYYGLGGLRCLTQQGPSFALWCIAIAVAGSGIAGAMWLLESDFEKAKLLKKTFSRVQGSRGPTSPARSFLQVQPMAPREPVTAPTTSVVVPAGFHYQPDAGMYYSDEQKTFFDQRNGHYFSAEHNSWYNPDTKQWYVKEEHASPPTSSR
jgi:hypothetical protein